MSPMRLRSWLVLLLVGLAGCGGGPSDAITFKNADAGFTFTYPRDFISGFTAVSREIDGREPRFSTNVGIDEINVVVVSRYTIKRPYESYKADEFQPFVDAAVRALAQAADLRVTKKGRVDLGGLEAYTYDLEGEEGAGGRMILGFKGRDQWFVRCNWDAEGQARLPRACDDVRDSFDLATA